MNTLHHLAALDHTGHATEGVGYLDMREYNRFVWAWAKGGEIASWLYSAGNLNTTGETDVRVDSSATASINLPATWLAADEITRILQQLNRFPEPEDAANDKIGASLALDLGRAVSAADHNWPREQKPHLVTHMRCGGCEQLTLKFRPPRWAGDKIRVDCWCGYELTEAEFALAAEIIKNDLEAAA